MVGERQSIMGAVSMYEVAQRVGLNKGWPSSAAAHPVVRLLRELHGCTLPVRYALSCHSHGIFGKTTCANLGDAILDFCNGHFEMV